MQVIYNVIGIIICLVVVGIVVRLIYFIGSESFIIKEITKFIQKFFEKRR